MVVSTQLDSGGNGGGALRCAPVARPSTREEQDLKKVLMTGKISQNPDLSGLLFL
jgi:hypothetical protein